MLLLEAVAQGAVSRQDISVTTARQILAFNKPEIAAALEKSWGTLRTTAKDKVTLLSKYKQ